MSSKITKLATIALAGLLTAGFVNVPLANAEEAAATATPAASGEANSCKATNSCKGMEKKDENAPVVTEVDPAPTDAAAPAEPAKAE